MPEKKESKKKSSDKKETKSKSKKTGTKKKQTVSKKAKASPKKAKPKAAAPKAPEEASTTQEAPKEQAYVEFEIPIEEIILGDHQPRSREGIEAWGSLTQLKNSIRDIGLLQPILVQQQEDGGYLLISGERRYRSCKELGHRKIRAVLPSNRTIHALKERGKTLDELALFENLQRENLTAIEEGRCFEKLLGLLELTQEGLGERLGLKQAYISERIGFLALPDEVQGMIENGEINSSQARELGRLKDLPDGEREEKQVELAKKMLVEKITVKKAKKLVDQVLGKEDKRDGSHLTRLGAKKAIYFISTLNEKFDEIDLGELKGEEDLEKLQKLADDLPALIKKLQGLKKEVSKRI